MLWWLNSAAGMLGGKGLKLGVDGILRENFVFVLFCYVVFCIPFLTNQYMLTVQQKKGKRLGKG